LSLPSIFDLSGNDNLTSPTPGELIPIWLAVLCPEFHIPIDNTLIKITSTYLHIDISVRVHLPIRHLGLKSSVFLILQSCSVEVGVSLLSWNWPYVAGDNRTVMSSDWGFRGLDDWRDQQQSLEQNNNSSPRSISVTAPTAFDPPGSLASPTYGSPVSC
jgi:hypothetical protein